MCPDGWWLVPPGGRPPDAPTQSAGHHGGGPGVHRTPHRRQPKTGLAVSAHVRGGVGRAVQAVAGGVYGEDAELKFRV